MSPSVFETTRLTARPMSPGDTDTVHALMSDPLVMRHYPRPWTRDECIRWVEHNQRLYEERGLGLWMLTLRADGSVAGDCGLTIQRIEDEDEIEIGYHLVPKLWGRGLASEAARATRDRAFAELGLARLVAIIAPTNEPSANVARAIGMRLEREMEWRGRPQGIFALDRGSIIASP